MATWLWRIAWLLVPLAWVAERFGVSPPLVFALSALSLIPLARTMGNSTEALAERLGPAPGSLLNATFGNAAELILGIVALRHGHLALVKGSLTGSIFGNLLLVAGGSIVVGGVRFEKLRFNRLAASSSIATLFLAVVAMTVPTFIHAARPVALSASIGAVLIAMYGLSLLFQLRTHARHLAGEAQPADVAGTPRRGIGADLTKLFVAAAVTAVASELLVGALQGAVETLHVPEMFVGVIIIAIVGNAAEHSSALLFGRRGEMDVALGIAWESSKQIALFVAPVLVFAGIAMSVPMDLAFTRLEVIALGASVLSLALIALDGETNWLEGAFLLAIYAVLGIGFYFTEA